MDLTDLSLVDRVARLEQHNMALLEITQTLGKRVDGLEAQLDRLKFDVDTGVQASDIFVAEQEAKDARNLAMAALRSSRT